MIILIALTILFRLSLAANQPSMRQPIYTKDNPFVPSSTIAIVTFSAPGTKHEELLDPVTTPNKRQYAARNGYDFINAFEHEDIQQDYLEHQAVHSYSAAHYYKLRLLPFLLRKYKYDWLMWSDSDAIFLNFSKPLQPHLDTNYDLIFSSNPPGKSEWRKVINTGHFFVRNTPWAIKFLYQAYGLSFVDSCEYMHSRRPINGWLFLSKGRGNQLWNDQRILQYFVSYTPQDVYGCHFKHVHFFNFNSEFPDYRIGDLVVHFPGRPDEERCQLIKELLEICNHEDGTIDFNRATLVHRNEDADSIYVHNSGYGLYNRPCKPNQ